jgi:hypothetical protein
MMTKWTSKAGLPGSEGMGSLADQFVVLLLYGKNSFGDKIYSYLKITLPNLANLKSAVKSGGGFNPSDFGEVIAAGKGEPTTEVRNEIAAQYQVLDNKPAAAPAVDVPATKKAWDEY